MEDFSVQINNFFDKCDELMDCKFILADRKISELLKSIAVSDILYSFFEHILKSFDYNKAKSLYFNYSPDTSNKKTLLFPEEPSKKLAFIFCILVDFDCKKLDLNNFLQEYFYEDGSYFESFYVFCNQLIKPMKSLIRQVFKNELEEPSARQADSVSEENIVFDKDCFLGDVDAERNFISDNKRIPEKARYELLNILYKIYDCILNADGDTAKALLYGYKFGIKLMNVSSPNLINIEKRMINMFG